MCNSHGNHEESIYRRHKTESGARLQQVPCRDGCVAGTVSVGKPDSPFQTSGLGRPDTRPVGPSLPATAPPSQEPCRLPPLSFSGLESAIQDATFGNPPSPSVSHTSASATLLAELNPFTIHLSSSPKTRRGHQGKALTAGDTAGFGSASQASRHQPLSSSLLGS